MELMVDIETLSTHPDATVLSIGAVAFSTSLGVAPVAFSATLDTTEQTRRRIDADTVAWWIKQAAENPGAITIFGDERPEPVAAALQRFTDYVHHWCTRDEGIWANGPDFDLVILRSLYEDAGLVPPWRHTQHRCFRTLKQLVRSIGAEVRVEPNEQWHNATSDADYQARYLIAAMEQLGVEA